MLKYDLVEIVRPLIIEGLNTLDIQDVENFEVLDRNQFTLQEIENHTITFQIINDRKIGAKQSKNVIVDDEYKRKYTQKKEITFQLMCFLKEDVENLTYTANDILGRVALFFGTESVLMELNNHNIGFVAENEVKELPIKDAGENYIIVSSINLIFVCDDSFEVGIKKIEEVRNILRRI